MKKFDIFTNLNLEVIYSQDVTRDISLAYESSTLLRSTKYATTKTKIFFNFIKYTPLNILKLFFITIVSKHSDNSYIGTDGSCRCIVKEASELIEGNRYEMYGKLSKEKYLVLKCVKVLKIDYKKLVYQLL
ncbi:hypothetical protein P3W45_001420 [Vairimorpha bombi]|jgi:hypothetical protein